MSTKNSDLAFKEDEDDSFSKLSSDFKQNASANENDSKNSTFGSDEKQPKWNLPTESDIFVKKLGLMAEQSWLLKEKGEWNGEIKKKKTKSNQKKNQIE